ncbi:hypothetical protein [Streptomyces sp. NPDC007172]|uniref:hypothetical protein n=1 Tax=unclassified Streptomyces TaxID=2593676 RepID=UPI0036AF9035
MSKKQTRQNRGARTGGHDRTATTAEAKEQTQSPVSSATMHSTPEVSHKRSRKFGHN